MAHNCHCLTTTIKHGPVDDCTGSFVVFYNVSFDVIHRDILLSTHGLWYLIRLLAFEV